MVILLVGHLALVKKLNHQFENAYRVKELKANLVLKFLPSDIEDTIYFMKHRDYVKTHGQGLMIPEIVYSMTDKALSVLQNKELPEEEKVAFKEALWKIESKIYGVGSNIKGWKKLWKSLRS